MIALLLLAACGSPDGSIAVAPDALDWGKVDFQADLPAEGYDARSVEVTNTGDAPIDVEINGFDTDHLVLGAILALDAPPTLPTLEPGSTQLLTVGVGGYLDGERDTVVEGSFLLDSPDLAAPVEVTWAFEPYRDLDDDTGP